MGWTEIITTLDTLLMHCGDFITGIATSLGVVLVAAAGIYLAVIGWRAFKAASSRI